MKGAHKGDIWVREIVAFVESPGIGLMIKRGQGQCNTTESLTLMRKR